MREATVNLLDGEDSIVEEDDVAVDDHRKISLGDLCAGDDGVEEGYVVEVGVDTRLDSDASRVQACELPEGGVVANENDFRTAGETEPRVEGSTLTVDPGRLFDVWLGSTENGEGWTIWVSATFPELPTLRHVKDTILGIKGVRRRPDHVAQIV